MLYPKFIDAEYSIVAMPVRSRIKRYIIISLKCIFVAVVFVAALFGLFCLTVFINPITEGSSYIDIISSGASIVTFFSAIISVLSLFDATCLKKYDDNLRLFENRYLDGKRLSEWEFLDRRSYYSEKEKNPYNHFISSACYKLYFGNNYKQVLEIIIPILAVDFHDVPCLPRIFELHKFIPKYQTYLNDEQKKFNNLSGVPGNTAKPPNYYIPLPQHIMALYKKIIEHKILKNLIALLFLLIICQIIVCVVCIVNYDVIFNVLSSQ